MENWTLLLALLIASFFEATCDPCVDGNFDSITCSLNGRLYVTRNNNLYRGHCDRLPYSIDQEVDILVSPSSRPVKILASVVDHENTVYFFERDQVIVMINSFTVSLPIGSVFRDFTDIVMWAVLIPSPEDLRKRIMSNQILQIYTTSGQIYDYNRKDVVKGLPVWSQTALRWLDNTKNLPKNIQKLDSKTRPIRIRPYLKPKLQLLHIVGIRGTWIVALSRQNSNLIYGETSRAMCPPLLYFWSLRNCALNPKQLRVVTTEDLFSCVSPRHFLNIFTVFYWISIGLVCLGALLVFRFIIKSCPNCQSGGVEESESSSEVSNEDNEDVEQPNLPPRTRKARRRSRSPRNRQRYRERSRELHRYINFVNTVNQQFPLGTANVINHKSAVVHNSVPITQAEQSALLPPPIKPLPVSLDQNLRASTQDLQLQEITEPEPQPQQQQQQQSEEPYTEMMSDDVYTHSKEIDAEPASRNSIEADYGIISSPSEPFQSQVPKILKVSDVYLDNEGKILHHQSSNNSLHYCSVDN